MTPITQTCRLSGVQFVISDLEQEFLRKMEVPLPTISPYERMRRRLSFRNERLLYHRKCDLTGKQIISSASQDKKYPVYCADAWWSDDWSPLDYGRDFDFSRPFFEQYFELRDQVPRLALQQQRPMINSEYCNCASKNKNCYLCFSTNHCEDCYYGSWINFSKDCVDNENSLKNELAYETNDCESCYNCVYSEECHNCNDVYFSKACIGCKNIIFCTNLKNKEYCIFNKKYSKDEFKKFKQEMNLGSNKKFSEHVATFEKMKSGMIVKEYHGTNNENVTGNHITNCKNSFWSYMVTDCEDATHCASVEVGVRNCMDYTYWGGNAERIYECQACGYDLFNLRFCNLCWSNCSDLTYCDHCFSSSDCFGCIGLKKAKYCILNKQYTKEEYEELVPRIIEHMKKTKEFGEFFPTSGSPFAYNETLAVEYTPLNREEVLARGNMWKEADAIAKYQGPKVEIPDNITDAPEDICSQILTCEVSGKLYKVIPQELRFLRKMNLPIPRRCPDQRHADRMARRNPRVLYQRQCAKTHKEIWTTYSPERPEKVYCEEAYREEFI
ncbi:MAG: hypothetical protein Q8P68_00600 [Candidatus Peregrinibacteria bacterium]|nr:hypothetical protein [Candidatus Peregrinibacteria bacterium]MDZ4245200.1 hypothetical protein [Candidatus Gracilibacteria bacterium]